MIDRIRQHGPCYIGTTSPRPADVRELAAWLAVNWVDRPADGPDFVAQPLDPASVGPVHD